MKILFITSLLSTNKFYGGAEISTSLLLDKLSATGIDVKAITTRKVLSNDIHLISISYPIEIPKKILTIGNRQLDYLLARRIKKEILNFNPDLIHVQDSYILPAVTLANKRFKLPCVVTIRNTVIEKTWEQMFPLRPIAYLLKKRNRVVVAALRSVNHIITVSEYTKGELISLGFERSIISPIYNLPPVYDLNNIAKTNIVNSEKIKLLAPGFLATFKGFKVLIMALKHVIIKQRNVHLTISGNGPQRQELEQLTKKLQLTSYVTFTGTISHKHLPQLYCASDIVIFPSIYPEPFGRIALEAMFFGKPIIASKVGGLPEIVEHGQTGLLIQPNNPRELAESIILLSKDRFLRQKMGICGQEVVKTKFSADKISDQTMKVYQDTIVSNKLKQTHNSM